MARRHSPVRTPSSRYRKRSPGDATPLGSIEGSWNKGTIKGNRLTWKSGAITLLDNHTATSLWMMRKGEAFTAELKRDGKLHWSNGSIWHREPDKREAILVSSPSAIDTRLSARVSRAEAAGKAALQCDSVEVHPVGSQDLAFIAQEGCETHKQHDEGCLTAPCILERLLTSPLPKWAEQTVPKLQAPSEGDGTDEICSNETSFVLGRWARDSQVGARVRSASELPRTPVLETRDIRETQSGPTWEPMEKPRGPNVSHADTGPGGGGGPAGSSGERIVRTFDVQSRSASEKNMFIQRDLLRSMDAVDDRPQRTLLGSITPQRSNIVDPPTSSRKAGESRKPSLPPKPRMPPPSYKSNPMKADHQNENSEPVIHGIEQLRQLAAQFGRSSSCAELAAQFGRSRAIQVGSLLRRLEMELRPASPADPIR
jgi:hypothetical protein